MNRHKIIRRAMNLARLLQTRKLFEMVKKTAPKVKYEPHPVTPERKRQLREQGYRIVDIRFKPKGIKDDPEETDPPTAPVTEKKTTRRKKADE